MVKKCIENARTEPQPINRDALIDLIGYRRFGHNEQDEPAYTQPAMVERIKNHPTVRDLFASKLVNQGVLPAERRPGGPAPKAVLVGSLRAGSYSRAVARHV